jgi:DDE_Tnp_1-associated/Transposase DDE domain
MAEPYRPLIEVLGEIPDPRSRQGRRHPLPALLALACTAMLCGYQSYGAIAEWSRHYGRAWMLALGLTHPIPPCAATLHSVFRRLDRQHVEGVLGAWAESVLQATQGGEPSDVAVALDGKTLRGTQRQGVPGAHLLSAVSQQLGLTLGQVGVDAKTNEIPVAQTLLAGLVLQGRVFTMDALLTQRAIAATIVAGGGDYVMVAKGNHPQLRADIALVFDAPPPPSTPPARSTRGMGASKSGS